MGMHATLDPKRLEIWKYLDLGPDFAAEAYL